MADDKRIALAVVARPHGVRGELKLKLYNPSSEVLLGKPKVFLAPREGAGRWVRLANVRKVPGTLLIRLDGVRDKETADTLRGARLEVLRSVLETPDEDEFYNCDLEGCEVRLDGDSIGKVLRVTEYPTMDVLEVVGNERRHEVPLHANYVRKVDVHNKLIELVTLDGLDPFPALGGAAKLASPHPKRVRRGE